MSAAPPITDQCRPALARGVKMRHDPAREQWILNAPERVLVLDEIARAILSRCDGTAPFCGICDALVLAYDAPRDEIRADVAALLQDLRARGFVTY